MKKTRIVTALLVLLLVLSLLPAPGVQAAKEAADFAGNRTVEFTFQSSDLDNYANGGRPAMDLYLRRDAPQWLTYTLEAQGYEVALTYSFDFESYNDYTQKLAVLLTYQPGILYVPGQVLVEEFDSAALLGSIQSALGNSETLHQRAQVTKNILTLNGQEHDCTENGVKLMPQTQPEILLRSLEVTTTQKKDSFERTVAMVVGKTYTELDRWQELTEQCRRLGDVTEEDVGDALKFTVTFQAVSQQGLMEKTDACLEMPVSLSVQLTQATEESCTYLRSESYLLEGYLEEGGYFGYSYVCDGELIRDIAVVSEETQLRTDSMETEDGLSQTHYVEAQNQPSIKFSYTAPFRFDTVSVQTDWPSALKKAQRTITLTAPTHGAQVYHETIKKTLTDAMPKGTVLEIYDQDQVRYYVLKYGSWFWKDVESFTNCFLDAELTVSDSWLPMGTSTCVEDLENTRIIQDFDPAHSVQVSYNFPDGSKTFLDTTSAIRFDYQHLNIIKLVVEVLGLAVLVVVSLLVGKQVKKVLKNRPQKVREPKKPEPEAAKQFCGSCGTELKAEDTFCPNCGSPRT